MNRIWLNFLRSFFKKSLQHRVHQSIIATHDGVIKWKHFPLYWPFVWVIHRSPVDSPHKGQWRDVLMFSSICAWTNDWTSNRDAGDLVRHRTHYDVTVLQYDPGYISYILWVVHFTPAIQVQPGRRQNVIHFTEYILWFCASASISSFVFVHHEIHNRVQVNYSGKKIQSDKILEQTPENPRSFASPESTNFNSRPAAIICNMILQWTAL